MQYTPMSVRDPFEKSLLKAKIIGKQFNDNRQDIDIAAFTYNDAKYIRKEIQINNGYDN